MRNDSSFTVSSDPYVVGHAINLYKHCPDCNSRRLEVRNYDEIWRDGDVHCQDCGAYVRSYDAG